ncbi:hypothetical protein C8Q70DRAFT_1055563 [Cubamyces menziesii]|nr:hypothetical protein C8Q70DRAFT_1055563 [Cubamyces menziesii]
MDFVDSTTGQPVNRPFDFQLVAGAGETDAPWLGLPLAMPVVPIEYKFGYKPEDILPGKEKYILRDGQQCVLTRPGKPTIRFTVPIRERADSTRAVAAAEPTIYLDFPKIQLPPL